MEDQESQNIRAAQDSLEGLKLKGYITKWVGVDLRSAGERG